MSSTICSEKIHHPPCSLESSNQRNRETWLSCLDGTVLHLSLTFWKKRRWPLKYGGSLRCAACSTGCFSVYFLKYLCLIPASVTCPVQHAADTLWQCREASGQHRREQATLWIINGINQHLWCGWQFAEAGRLLLSALGKLFDQTGQQLS